MRIVDLGLRVTFVLARVLAQFRSWQLWPLPQQAGRNREIEGRGEPEQPARVVLY